MKESTIGGKGISMVSIIKYVRIYRDTIYSGRHYKENKDKETKQEKTYGSRETVVCLCLITTLQLVTIEIQSSQISFEWKISTFNHLSPPSSLIVPV